MLTKIKNIIIDAIKDITKIDAEEISKILGQPPKKEMGDLSFPCFILAKTFKKAPPIIATDLLDPITKTLESTKIKTSVAGPYLNFSYNKKEIIKLVEENVLNNNEKILPQVGAKKTIVVDFSSPNIAKPFSMGHLRSTTIGNSIALIHKALGYQVERINHIGDWGTQFGKLICAYNLNGDEKRLKNEGINYLMELYVDYNKKAKEDPTYDDNARIAFKELEEGKAENIAIWEKFRDISLAEFLRLYKKLHIEFDSFNGESFYNDKIEAAIKTVEDAGLLVKSEGAMVVEMDEDIPPAIIRKSDGATTYIARDLAALLFRSKEYKFDKMVYVVGSPQALHFKQLFTIIKKLNIAKIENISHIPFGQVLINGEMMSTRKGNVIFLEDVIDKAADLSYQKITENSDSLTDTDVLKKRATEIAVSSIIFFDLKNNRIKDVDFNWDEILNPKGETGIYLQYAHARIHGIMKKFEKTLNIKIDDITTKTVEISEEEAYPIMTKISKFPERVITAAKQYEPSFISRYLLELTSAFSTYYRANKVINPENRQLSIERMKVVLTVKEILSKGLKMIGINPLQEM